MLARDYYAGAHRGPNGQNSDRGIETEGEQRSLPDGRRPNGQNSDRGIETERGYPRSVGLRLSQWTEFRPRN